MPTYLAGKNATLTINSQNLAVEDGSIDEETETDEVTNLKSGGYYEVIATILKMTFNGISVVYDGAQIPTFNVGSTYAAAVSIPGGSSYSGTLLISRLSHKMITVKGAYRFTLDGTMTGSYTATF